MIILVTGASSSGKSQIAEAISCHQNARQLYYIATMDANDTESIERIKRHRLMRKDKGFDTIECPRNVGDISIVKGSVCLLECISNLVANEMYGNYNRPDDVAEHIISSIKQLDERCEQLVIVTNEVFSDDSKQDSFCREYIGNIGKINCALANMAHTVIESVAGIPIYHKGERYEYI